MSNTRIYDPRAMARQTNDPWELAKIIVHRERYAQKIPYEHVVPVKNKLAKLFAAQRGWSWSPRSFDIIIDLCRTPFREQHQFHRDLQELNYHTMDHPWFFRSNRRPVAVVTQPYEFFNGGKEDCDELVRRQPRLTYEHVTDFPSWWYPGKTELLVWYAIL